MHLIGRKAACRLQPCHPIATGMLGCEETIMWTAQSMDEGVDVLTSDSMYVMRHSVDASRDASHHAYGQDQPTVGPH